MWELSEAIDGMTEACRAFDMPVVGGNVSLYNETRGQRHRSDASRRRCWAWSTSSYAGRPGRCWRPAGRCSSLGGATAPSLAGSRWAWERGCQGRAAALLWTWTRWGVWRRWCESSSPTTCWPACTTWPTAAWRWRWPRWWRSPAERASGPSGPTTVSVRRGPRSGGGVRRRRPGPPRSDRAARRRRVSRVESWVRPEAIASCSARLVDLAVTDVVGRLAGPPARPPSAPPPATRRASRRSSRPPRLRQTPTRLRSHDGADEEDGFGGRG